MKKVRKRDITYNKDDCGNWVLSAYVDGQLKKMRYVFYTKGESTKRFLEYCNN